MGVVETAPAKSSEMCQASNDLSKAESDDDFKWEEFFGTSVDITSTLLDMFDTIVAKNVDVKTPLGPARENPPERSPKRHHRPARLYSKRSYPDSHPSSCDKRRPLSSSSSSSSCSSLPRCLSSDVKRSAYLASIESLEDDDHEHDKGGGSWVDHPDLSHMDRVILEIVDTEKTYVRDLGQIIGGYLNHMKRAQDVKISSKCLEELFSNVEDIYQFNSLFVKELEACGLDPVTVARCFVRSSCGFEVYTQYCTNYPRTVSVLTELMGNTQTAEIFKERQVSLQHSLPLGSYLLKPVQRILKYHLLLQNMVKHYCGGEEGCWDVKNALSVMTGIACHINDMKRKHEHAVRVQEIQSLLYGWEGQDLTTYGELVGEGAFRMYRAKALRHLFLFDRMLLIAKKREEGTLSYKTHIVCSNLMLIESIQGEPLCFHVIPFDNPRHQYTFQARNVEQKREWCLQLKRVILENYNAVIPSHARQLVMELGQSKTDDSVVERSLTKRPLSAPEYLEKRKQERRKSEINLKKSTTTLKKDDHKQRWPLGRLGNNNNKENNNCGGASSSSASSFSRGARARHSLPEPSLHHHKERRSRNHQSWRTWNSNSVPEETTDTENEEKLSDYRRLPPHSIYRDCAYSELSEEGFDNGGEYVTFFHAHAYATRDLNRAYLDIGGGGQERAHSDVENNAHGQEGKDSDGCCHSKHEQPKDQDSEGGSSWKQNPAIRRVQSFTGMAKAKVQSLQHNLSFKYSSSSQSAKTKKTLSLPPIGSSSSILPNEKTSSLPPSGSSSILPETSPAAWLKQQEEHLADVERKSGSLPRSFQLSSTNESNSLEDSRESLTKVSGRTRMRLDGTRCVHNERPFTIASDTPSQADFGDDLDYVLLDYSRYTGTEYYFDPQSNGYENDTTTGCTNTPAVSMENVHSIHPELKIYHQSASKYATLKHLFYHMGSKIAGFRATLVSPSPQDAISSSSELIAKTQCPSDANKNGFKRSGSHASIKSGENERNPPRILTAKLAHSVAKAYSSVMRHKKKHEIKITNVGRKKNEKASILGTYKSESSLIGARMAQPLESEYSVPKYILSPQFLKDLRPDSLFSESSSDSGDVRGGDKVDKSESCFHNSGEDDSVSEASDTSADSYYERTFDAIENALAQDVFRDSAIYSDPEDADFSSGAIEKPRLSFCSKESFEITKIDKTAFLNFQNGDADATSPKIMCARKVNQAILERLRVLEENVKIQNEELSNCSARPLKKLDLDKYGNLVSNGEAVEESETSSEHSASTVMEREHLTTQGSKGLPRMKGWVKHVVDKLQGEGPV